MAPNRPDNEEDLHQADLSGMAIKDMTPEQKAEMKRRFEEFVRAFKSSQPGASAKKAKPKVQKWTPQKAFRPGMPRT